MKSIRLKLWAGMMSLVLIVLILLWLSQIVFLQSFYENMRIAEIKKEATSIIRLYSEGNNSEFKDDLEKFAFNNNLSVELFDNSGNSLYMTGTGGQMPMMRNSGRVDVFKGAMAGNEVSIPVVHPRFGNKFMLIGIPIDSVKNVSGVLLISMPMAPVEDTASILKIQLFYITLILLAASLIIAFLISKSFTKPILEIKKVSEAMVVGDFTARIHSKKQDEIGELADTINNLGQELSKIEQLRKDFIANVSHELRTPLSLIRGYAETIRDVTGDTKEKREKQLDIIIEETERLGRIVDDILNLSQLQSGYIKLNKNTFSIEELLKKIVKRYDILSEARGVKIELQVNTEVTLVADEPRFEQVLYNLINNALNHTPEGGSITVRAIEIAESIKIEISDTGSGIDSEDIQHIWNRYYKADTSSGKKTVGTGLGLAIVKEVLEAHSANYGVESEIGIGTTFWVELKK